ncbi:hypothetical protein BDV93DRAFT_448146 [Ceratobasidium sp. AG-I]|nr:hypothetical protein BDV93DRAFT_448146 [Ceratobasidium sp. AG-I]
MNLWLSCAGPAGLMCAFNLSQAGFTVRIIDRKDERLRKGQGDAIQVRGIEILDSLGLLEPILRHAHQFYRITTYTGDSNQHIARVNRRDFHLGVESRFKYTLGYPQSEVEGVFREAMGSGEKAVIVEQGTQPTQLSVSLNSEYPVTVTLARADGWSETVKAKYVVGCDGAHSWTRGQLGLDMVGDTSDAVWGVIDTHVDTDFPDVRNISVVENNGRRGVLVPREDDLVRFNVQIINTDVGVDPTTGRIDRTKIQADKIKELVKEIFQPYRIDFMGEPDWWGAYVIGQRLASGYEGGQGRVFIVGDACHTHSPHAGQGMNAALSDGFNLSWKLVHVLKGWAGEDLLRTYESERRGFAQELMQLHERIAQVMSGKIPGNNADGTTIQYPPSNIVDTTNQALALGIPIGQRMPHQVILRTADCRPYSTHDLLKSDFRFKLLVFTGDVKEKTQAKTIETLSNDISQWIAGSSGSSISSAMVQIYTIMLSKKESSEYTDTPKKLRSHWDTVFMDDVALNETSGGGTAYRAFGIGPEGCVVVVRPDGHVAAIAPLDGVEMLKQFFQTIQAHN